MGDLAKSHGWACHLFCFSGWRGKPLGMFPSPGLCLYQAYRRWRSMFTI